MEHESIRDISFNISFIERSHNQINIRFCEYMLRNNLTGEKVYYDAQVVLFRAYFEKSKIVYPNNVGGLGVKLLMQMIGAVTIVRILTLMTGFVC